ncbi:hypothetical protein HOY34_13390 [Xinfangfangia sp. D13-10-4-6]|uniref:hypothetical protein n=1 Tax=Pseudogemmobacter hezensis TaxID=2737662 RepID=UPI0015554197|nr:hypothetical protein [Pseudogemmobacter hezensis]NPD16189.1 hypothetical protein [Pseudogemmobacter hezensis]
MPAQTVVLDLPSRADPLADPSLAAFFHNNRDTALRVNAAGLRQFSGLLAELLLTEAADRRERGIPFAISGVSTLHRAQLTLLGLINALPIAPEPSASPAPMSEGRST